MTELITRIIAGAIIAIVIGIVYDWIARGS
jgi:hypothetical protein